MSKKKIFKQIKKKTTDFLLEEDGKISKTEILKAGTIIIGASTIINSFAAQHYTHANSILINNSLTEKFVETTHSNHSSHSSHGSHDAW